MHGGDSSGESLHQQSLADLEHPEPVVRGQAVDALIRIGSPGVSALCGVMESGSLDARRAAAQALALIGDPVALPTLRAALGDSSSTVRRWSVVGMATAGIDALEDVRARCFDPSAPVAAAAVQERVRLRPWVPSSMIPRPHT